MYIMFSRRLSRFSEQVSRNFGKSELFALFFASLLLCMIIFQTEHRWALSTSSLMTAYHQNFEEDGIAIGLSHDVWQKCRAGNESGTAPLTLDKNLFGQIVVVEKYKILFCPIPKVACTNWRRVLLTLSGKVNATQPSDIHSDHVHSRYRHLLTPLSLYKPTQIRHRLLNYYKFMFVRNPFERLLSAWRNKFNNTSKRLAKRKYAPEILRLYRNFTGHHQLSKEELDRVQISFEEFLRFVVDKIEQGERPDNHWSLFHEHCQPCVVKYDFVGRMETLEQDAKHVLKFVHAERLVEFPERSRTYQHKKTLEVFEKHYKEIPASLLRRVYRIYRKDFELFNYTIPDFLRL